MAFAGAAAHPIAAAQFIEHGTTNALAGKGLKLHPMAGFVARQGIGQANHAHLDQIVQLHTGRQPGHHVLRNPPHQRGVLADQGIKA